MTQNNLCHGIYDVVLTDDNGCRLDQQVSAARAGGTHGIDAKQRSAHLYGRLRWQA